MVLIAKSTYKEYTEDVKCQCGNTLEVAMSSDHGMDGPIDENPIICDACGGEIKA